MKCGGVRVELDDAQQCRQKARHRSRPGGQLLIKHGVIGAPQARDVSQGLGACRTWDVDSKKRPQRGQFLLDLPAHSPAMGQKDGEKWTAAAASQPTLPKSDRLLDKFVLSDRVVHQSPQLAIG